MGTMEIARGFLWVEEDSEDGFSEDDFFTAQFLQKLYKTTIQLRQAFPSVVPTLKKKPTKKIFTK